MTDLLDPAVRAQLTEQIGQLWAGRPVLVGPSVLAAATRLVGWFTDLGCPVLVVATSRGTGAAPEPGSCEVVGLTPPPTASLTDELRTHDRLLHQLPEEVLAAVERTDPEVRGRWWATPFVTTDEPAAGRPVTGGRPRAWLALEDKLLADALWDAAGVPRPPSRIVDLTDGDALDAAQAELAAADGNGTVWSGDARDGFNGGGDHVRWVREPEDRAGAEAFFRLHCDRVRVAPILDGVPCSIHGLVLPDGVAVFRPVEIATLRDPARRAFAYCGVGTTWDTPAVDRDEMRAVARRVGAHLQAGHGYRGAFGIDGVLTADGFRPTELNTRMTAGLSQLADVDRRFFTLLQGALVAGVDTRLTAPEVEALVALMDEHRSARVVGSGDRPVPADTPPQPLAWDGARFTPATGETGNVLSVGPIPSGFFARVEPCAALRTGERVAPLNAALLAHLDAHHGTSHGALEPAPDVRSTELAP